MVQRTQIQIFNFLNKVSYIIRRSGDSKKRLKNYLVSIYGNLYRK